MWRNGREYTADIELFKFMKRAIKVLHYFVIYKQISLHFKPFPAFVHIYEIHGTILNATRKINVYPYRKLRKMV